MEHRVQAGKAEITILRQYLASSRPVNALSAKCNTFSCDGPWQVVTLIAGKQRSLLMAGNDDEMFMTRRFNITLKTAEQHLIVYALVNLKPK